MADKLEKMKAKLQKQKEKQKNIVKKVTIDPVFKIKTEKKKPPKFIPRGKMVETKANEEEEIREKLRGIQSISDPDEREKALILLKNRKNAPYGSESFFQKLIKLPIELQDKFIQAYLIQPEGYSTFFTTWIEDPEVAEEVQQYVLDMDEKGEKIDIPLGTSDIRQVLLSRLIALKENKNIEVEPSKENNYYTLLEAMYPDKKKAHSVHKKIAKDYINLAKILATALGKEENVEDLSIGQLASDIIKYTKALEGMVSSEFLTTIRSLSPEKLRRMAKKEGIVLDKEDTPEIVRIKLIQKKVSTLGALHMPHKVFDENNDDYIIENKTKLLDVGNKRIETKEEQERNRLIDKIVRITGIDKNRIKNEPLHRLKEKYQELEGEQTYWEQIERETVIEKLAELTNKDPEFYEDVPLPELIETLNSYEEKNDIYNKVQTTENQGIIVRKCIQNFRLYEWINAKVTGVWLSQFSGGWAIDNDISAIKEYIIPEDKINVKIDNQIITFYKANKNFFSLHCNKNSKYRKQDGYNLICYDSDGKKIEFMVGFTILEGKYKKYKTYKITTPRHNSEKFLLQDEELFEKELDTEYKRNEEKEDRIEEVLNHKVDKRSIEIASYALSSALSKVGPNVKDYQDKDSPYIRIAIDSIYGPEKTNRSFFETLAETLVYLKMPQLKIFHDRVKAEYYLPDMLMKLSPEDKLGDNLEQSGNVVSMISDSIEHNVRKLAESILIQRDPTYKPMRLESPKIDIVYTKEECVNGDDLSKIKEENRIFYKDPDDNKIYCLDSEEISGNFDKGDYTNPKTKKKFDKNFIRRYTISYFDQVDKKMYTFPFKKLHKDFSKGNLINKKTGRIFDEKFVKAVLSGNSADDSVNHRLKKFKRLDINLLSCQNPEDVIDESVENVIYYKDSQDGLKYCFSIVKLNDIITVNEYKSKNPYTDRKFSKKFIDRFKKLYNVNLAKKGVYKDEERKEKKGVYEDEDLKEKYGIHQKEFAEKYGNQYGIEHRDIVEVGEDVQKKQDLVIPNLWEFITKVVANDKRKDHEDEENEDEENEDNEDEEEDEEKMLFGDEPASGSESVESKEETELLKELSTNEDSKTPTNWEDLVDTKKRKGKGKHAFGFPDDDEKIPFEADKLELPMSTKDQKDTMDKKGQNDKNDQKDQKEMKDQNDTKEGCTKCAHCDVEKPLIFMSIKKMGKDFVKVGFHEIKCYGKFKFGSND